MFISSRPSLHLWLKENLVKHQNVSKYYENDFLQNFLLLFMSLLIAKVVKKCHFGLEFILSFKKSYSNKFEILLISNFNLTEKFGKEVTN